MKTTMIRMFLVLLCLISGSAAAQGSSLARLEKEIVAFEARDNQALPPRGAIVITGSSTIRLWSTMQKDLAPLTVVNRGFGGSTIQELGYYLDRIVIPYSPSAVVIYEGDNDIADGKTPQFIAEEHARVMARLRQKLPDVRLYVIAIKPSLARWEHWANSTQANAMLESVCRKDPGCVFIDPSSELLENGKPVKSYFVKDQLHLSPAGYEAWTRAIKPVLLAREGAAAGR